MPNSIVVSDRIYVMNPEYVRGALAERCGLRVDVTAQNEDFVAGARNEWDRQHIRFDVDVLTAPDQNRLFQEDDEFPVALKTSTGRFKVSYGNYRRDLLVATGAVHAARVMREEPGGSRFTGAAMRKELAARGIFVSTEDCHLIGALFWHETKMRDAQPSLEELTCVRDFRPSYRKILDVCAELEARDWNYHPMSDVVSAMAGRSSGWAAATALRMRRDGLERFLTATGNGAIPLRLRKPQKKDFPTAGNNICVFDDEDCSVVFDNDSKTARWTVHENNHAVEHARASVLGTAFFAAMAKVTWTRGSGGQIVGNDEYNQDAGRDYAGGGGSYVTAEFSMEAQKRDAEARRSARYAPIGSFRRF